jgi:hypothetical protein
LFCLTFCLITTIAAAQEAKRVYIAAEAVEKGVLTEVFHR